MLRCGPFFFSLFFPAFVFGVTQAFKRRLCFCICYFSVFCIQYSPFLGPNMLQRGDNAREICYFVVKYAEKYASGMDISLITLLVESMYQVYVKVSG